MTRSRPTAAYKPMTMAMSRYQSKGPPYDRIDPKNEEKLANKNLEAHPETVSVDSSVHPVFGEVGLKEDAHEKDADMMAGVKADMVP